ncbi:MAG: hypothetical protein RL215_2833 [Planctomycetota bacterium]
MAETGILAGMSAHPDLLSLLIHNLDNPLNQQAKATAENRRAAFQQSA